MLPVLLHGDAAFAGQGVVAETLNLSELPGLRRRRHRAHRREQPGRVHDRARASRRSTVYATDIAKAVQAPIFHVNGDDPEASVRVIRLAFEFRQQFKKDVVVDMVCYRRYGHNESRRARVHAAAHVRGDRPAPLGAQALHRAAREPRRPHARRGGAGARRLPGPARSRVRARRTPSHAAAAAPSISPRRARRPTRDDRSPTRGVAARRLDAGRRRARSRSPTGFDGAPEARAHPRQPRARSSTTTRSTGRSPRRSRSARCCSRARRCALAGQDTRRGTFSQRHARARRPRDRSRSTRRSRTSATTRRRS